MKNTQYPPIGSVWSDNDSRSAPRKLVVVAHDTTNRRVRMRNTYGKAETWIRLEAFYSKAQRGFSEVKA